MKKSSKSRLTVKQLAAYPGDTLFARIARAVCRAGTLPAKELYEAWEVARRVRRRYRGARVVDMACGHGLLAHVMLLLDDSSPEALAVDTVIPQNARTVVPNPLFHLAAAWRANSLSRFPSGGGDPAPGRSGGVVSCLRHPDRSHHRAVHPCRCPDGRIALLP